MVQNVKSVLVGLTKQFGAEDASSALAYGLSLARESGAHLTVQAASVRLVLTTTWVSGFASRLVEAENRRLHALAEAVARSAQAEAAAAGVICSTETPHLEYPDLLASFADQARVHDLTVLDAEPEALDLDRGLLERLVTGSGRPLLIVPRGTEVFRGRRIIVAWDGSAKAARAASDALPFMRAADAVEVVSVTGEKDLAGTLAGAALAPHLARHGVPVSVSDVAAQDGDVAQTLRNHADLFGADMIVMGAYVHSRLREFVFGGVTESLLKRSPVPLFLSH